MKPTAWYDPTNGAVSTDKDSPLFTPLGQVWPLYLPSTWTGLTDEEIDGMVEITDLSGAYYYDDLLALARVIEAKLKEKNNG